MNHGQHPPVNGQMYFNGKQPMPQMFMYQQQHPQQQQGTQMRSVSLNYPMQSQLPARSPSQQFTQRPQMAQFPPQRPQQSTSPFPGPMRSTSFSGSSIPPQPRPIHQTTSTSPPPSSLHHLISSSPEHQKCVQFLKTKGFGPQTALAQRQAILQKINQALHSNYRPPELGRRIQVLQQCATFILSPNSPNDAVQRSPSNPPNTGNAKPPQNTSAQTVPDLLSSDLLSTELSNRAPNAIPHISDDVTSSVSGNTPSFPGNVHNAATRKVPAEESGFEAFGDPFGGDDGFGEFESAAPSEQTKTMSHTVDLLGDLNANTEDIHNAEDTENPPDDVPEDDFSKFVESIKVDIAINTLYF